MKKTHWAHFVLGFAILFLFQQLASTFGGFFANQFRYESLDPNHVFMHVSVHHVVQMAVAFLAIYVITLTIKLKFNLLFAFSKTGVIHVLIFCAVILIYVLLTYFMGYKMGTIQPYPYPLTWGNVLGTLGFQLLLSGPSEEILFRALPLTIFLSMFKNDVTERKKNIVALLLTSVLFSLAHISWSYSGLTFDWFQLIYAFILGLAYGFTYIKSKSIVYPMIMHSMSNVLMVGAGYIFSVSMNIPA